MSVIPYQPHHSHRRPAVAGRRRQRLLLDRPSVADRRKAEADGDRKPDHAARLQAGADADAEAGAGLLQRQLAVAERLAAPSSRISARARIGDILTVTVNITDKANIANETQRSRTSKEDSGITDFIGSQDDQRQANKILPGRILTADSTVVERRQGFGQPPGSVADQRRRRGHAGAAERQSRGRGQAGNPRQLRNPRTDRRRHRPPRRHPERQHHQFLARSRRPASPMAAAARSPTCSSRATASR